MSQIKSFYLISNSCIDQYPENSLTNFTNRFPLPIILDQNEKWELGIESFGISTNFANIKIPGKNIPSFFTTTCQPETSGMELILPDSYEAAENCNMKGFYLKNKFFRKGDLIDLRDEVLDKIPNSMIIENDQIIFQPTTKKYWILMHQTFRENFGFVGTIFNISVDLNKVGSYITKILLSNKIHNVKVCLYNCEIYHIFEVSDEVGKLESEKFNLDEKIYPQILKIKCDAIRPQILNQTMTKDMIIFSPDFNQRDDYYFKEIEVIDYIPIAYTTLKSITISIQDENNNPLALTKGHASIIKMNLRQVHPLKESFNIRITSEKTTEFPNNTNTEFSNRLPFPIKLDSSWKVCLINVNYPSKFTTFLKDENTRSILFKSTKRNEENKPLVFWHKFNPDIIYTQESLVREFQEFLKVNDIGFIEFDDNKRIILNLYQKGKIKLSYYLARILGWDILTLNEPAFYLKNTDVVDINDPNKPRVVSQCHFKSSIDLKILKPNYVMIYCNIIKSSLLGETYTKILKIAPLQETNQDYVLKEFKNKEYKELENTEISKIEVHFRSHDGEHINFYGSQNVIVNLEFSNHQE
jgi:hypothetical protein